MSITSYTVNISMYNPHDSVADVSLHDSDEKGCTESFPNH